MNIKLYQGMNGAWFVKVDDILRGGFHAKEDAELFFKILKEAYA